MARPCTLGTGTLGYVSLVGSVSRVGSLRLEPNGAADAVATVRTVQALVWWLRWVRALSEDKVFPTTPLPGR